MPKLQPPNEREVMLRVFPTGGVAAVHKLLPHLPPEIIRGRARTMGLKFNKPDDNILKPKQVLKNQGAYTVTIPKGPRWVFDLAA